jgi:hypothetical protein
MRNLLLMTPFLLFFDWALPRLPDISAPTESLETDPLFP